MKSDDAVARRWAAVYAERRRLLRLARRRTLNDAEAEDCVSEAMLRCVEFDDLDEARLSAFLTTVTVRLCADQHRERGRMLRAGGRTVGRPEEPSHEDGVCDRAEAEWLAERVVGLPAHQQRIVEARAAGMSCANAAAYLGVTVDAVKSAVARARTTLHAARDSAYGVLVAATSRYRAVAECATGTALAGAVAVGGLIIIDGQVRGGPVLARDRVVVIQRQAGAPGSDRPVPVLTPRPDADPAAGWAAPPTVSGPMPPPPPRPTGRESVTAGPATFVHEPDKYPIQERYLHCVTEGIQLHPTIRCNEPGDSR